MSKDVAEARSAEIAERVGDMPLIASALRRQIQIDEHGENCGVSRQACDHAAEIIDGVPDILAELSRLTSEIEQVRAMLADPVAVRVNLLRGTIAKPDDLIFMHDTNGPYARLQAALAALQTEE